MKSSPFQEGQIDIEEEVLMISERIQYIKQSNAQSQKASNNDSKSRGCYLTFETEGKRLNSNSIKAAQEGLIQITTRQGKEENPFKRDNSSSFHGVITKKRKLPQFKQLTVGKQSALVKKESLLNFYDLIEKPQSKLELKKQDTGKSYERSSQKKRKTDDLAQKLSQLQNQIETVQVENSRLSKKLERLEKSISQEQKEKRSVVENIYKEWLQYQQLKFIEEYSQFSSQAKRDPHLSKIQEQHRIYGYHLEQNKIKRPYDDNSNNVLELYEKDRKIYMKEMSCKIQTYINQLTSTQSTSANLCSKYPSINHNKNLSLKDRFLITGYKLFDRLGDEYYEILDLQSMHQCLGRLQVFSHMQKDTFNKLMTEASGLFNLASQLKHSLLLDQIDLISCNGEDFYGLMTISLFDAGSTTLYELLDRYHTFSQASTKYMMKKICGALNYLQQKNMFEVQQIVTPSNVVIRYGDVKLSNYGYGALSKFGKIYEGLNKTQNRFYYPPEFYHDVGGCKKITAWSFGVLFFQCIYGKKPFEYEPSNLKEFSFVEELVFPAQPRISQLSKQIMEQCLSANPLYRISIPELYKTEYFSNKI